MTRSSAPPVLVEVAAVTQRLAVLLAAGVAPVSAWRHVAEASGSPVPAAVAASEHPADEALLAAASDRPELEAQAWRGLAAAWRVATEAGSSLAPALRSYAGSLRELAQVQREIGVALAGPLATSRLVTALPAVGLLFGLALGFDTVRVLATTPVGWGCLGLGALLIVIAARWSRRLVAGAQPRDAVPGLGLELTAIAVSGGGALDRARALVDGALAAVGAGTTEGVDDVLELSRRAGVPAAELLRSEASERRRTSSAEAQRRAAALSVKLMLPLGACILPAFMLLGVVPMLLAVVQSTVGTF